MSKHDRLASQLLAMIGGELDVEEQQALLDAARIIQEQERELEESRRNVVATLVDRPLLCSIIHSQGEVARLCEGIQGMEKQAAYYRGLESEGRRLLKRTRPSAAEGGAPPKG